jgi:hypothetical protein
MAVSESRAITCLRYLLYTGAICLFLSGALGFVGTGFVASMLSADLKQTLHSVEFPIGHLTAFQIDRQQRIYTYDAAQSRIQLYDAQGQFLQGWSTPVFKGIPQLKTDELNVLHLSFGKQHWRLTPHSGFQPDAQAFDSLIDTATADSYELRSPILLPRIVRIDATGEFTLVQSKWQLYGLLAAPLLAWLGALAGILLMVLIGYLLPEPEAKTKHLVLQNSLSGLMQSLFSKHR